VEGLYVPLILRAKRRTAACCLACSCVLLSGCAPGGGDSKATSAANAVAERRSEGRLAKRFTVELFRANGKGTRKLLAEPDNPALGSMLTDVARFWQPYHVRLARTAKPLGSHRWSVRYAGTRPRSPRQIETQSGTLVLRIATVSGRRGVAIFQFAHAIDSIHDPSAPLIPSKIPRDDGTTFVGRSRGRRVGNR
jgi:hypothetical protein